MASPWTGPEAELGKAVVGPLLLPLCHLSEFTLLVGHLRLGLVFRKAAQVLKYLVAEVELVASLHDVGLLACHPVGAIWKKY